MLKHTCANVDISNLFPHLSTGSAPKSMPPTADITNRTVSQTFSVSKIANSLSKGGIIKENLCLNRGRLQTKL